MPAIKAFFMMCLLIMLCLLPTVQAAPTVLPSTPYLGAGNIQLSRYVQGDYLYLGAGNIPPSIVSQNDAWKLVRAVAIYLQMANIHPKYVYIDTSLISDAHCARLWTILNESNALSQVQVLNLTHLNQEKMDAMQQNARALTHVLITNLDGKHYNPTSFIASMISQSPQYVGGIFRGFELSKPLLHLYAKSPKLSVLGGEVTQKNMPLLTQWLPAHPGRLFKFYPVFSKPVDGSVIASVMRAATSQHGLKRLELSVAHAASFTAAAGKAVVRLIQAAPKLSLFLASGNMSDAGLLPVVTGLSHYSSMNTLVVGFNHISFAKHGDWIANMAGNTAIAKLIVRGGQLSNAMMLGVAVSLKQRLLPLVLDFAENPVSNVQPFLPLLKSGMIPALVLSSGDLSAEQQSALNAAGVPVLKAHDAKFTVLGLDASLIAKYPGYYFASDTDGQSQLLSAGIFGIIRVWPG
jgi:hypothetical protein